MALSPVKFSKIMQNPNQPGVNDVTPEEVLQHAKNLHVIDVRRPDEYDGELGHIENAQLLVLDTLPERLNEVPKDGTVVFICRSGNRSGQACLFAQENGYTNVFNMAGGMLAWNEKSFAVIKDEE